ncbi:MAG: cyclase family protein [Clostridia bacterium]|nr:cyclase family protein [Clostridia bacterium]
MLYDITQPLFTADIYPGDPKPEKRMLMRLSDGDVCNLTALSLCAHNGTHVDAPLHFLADGKGIGDLALSKFIGPAYVGTIDGAVTAEHARTLLNKAREAYPDAQRRILIRGDATVSLEAAAVFADAGVDLLGNESQTVGPFDAPAAVHLTLLKAEVVLLEGVRLSVVPDGAYLLNCAPINLGDCDGAPCRATLTTLSE